MGNGAERGTIRVLYEEIRLKSHEVESVLVEGLAVAGFDVDIEPDVKPGEILGPDRRIGGVTIKVYRGLEHV